MSEAAIVVERRASPAAVNLVSMRSFGGLLVRDGRVLRANLGEFLGRAIMQPLLFVFVFTYLFPKIGQQISAGGGARSFATVLVPGLVAVAAIFTGISAVGLPLAVELGYTFEIEDRVMAPVPVWAVALEKVVFGAAQSLLSALVVFPLVYLVPATQVSVHVSDWPLLVAVVVLTCLVSGALGLTLGTVVKPERIGLMFSVLVIPVTFLGCIYYPWAQLHAVRWLQILVLFNPLVYMSEGLRAALTPGVPHMAAWAFLLAITGSLAVLSVAGTKLFLRRVVT